MPPQVVGSATTYVPHRFSPPKQQGLMSCEQYVGFLVKLAKEYQF